MLSATIDVNNESIVPNTASEIAENTYAESCPICNCVKIVRSGTGKPLGISPMVRYWGRNNAAPNVTPINATRLLGTAVVIRLNP